jgi:Uma2 family endonuclease
MSEEEFYRFCSENDTYRIEREVDGTIVMEPPVGIEGGFFENKFNAALERWNAEQDWVKGITVSPSGGYMLPNGSIRSPDASWISLERLKGFTRDELKKFLPQCPEFVVEIRSPSDPLSGLQAKMKEWMENGALLGWLIDPEEKQAFIYRKNGSTDQVVSFSEKLSGEDVLPGFVFALSSLRFPDL